MDNLEFDTNSLKIKKNTVRSNTDNLKGTKKNDPIRSYTKNFKIHKWSMK